MSSVPRLQTLFEQTQTALLARQRGGGLDFSKARITFTNDEAGRLTEFRWSFKLTRGKRELPSAWASRCEEAEAFWKRLVQAADQIDGYQLSHGIRMGASRSWWIKLTRATPDEAARMRLGRQFETLLQLLSS